MGKEARYCQWWNPWCKSKRAMENMLNKQVLSIIEEQKKEEEKNKYTKGEA